MPGRTHNNASGDPVKEKFTGKERDVETGWDYFGARYYDPAIARWMATDLADQDASPYIYCGNNPNSRIDPDGLWWVEKIDEKDPVFNQPTGRSFYKVYFSSGVEVGVEFVLSAFIPGAASWMLQKRGIYVSPKEEFNDIVTTFISGKIGLVGTGASSLLNLKLLEQIDDPELIEAFERKYGNKVFHSEHDAKKAVEFLEKVIKRRREREKNKQQTSSENPDEKYNPKKKKAEEEKKKEEDKKRRNRKTAADRWEAYDPSKQ